MCILSYWPVNRCSSWYMGGMVPGPGFSESHKLNQHRQSEQDTAISQWDSLGCRGWSSCRLVVGSAQHGPYAQANLCTVPCGKFCTWEDLDGRTGWKTERTSWSLFRVPISVFTSHIAPLCLPLHRYWFPYTLLNFSSSCTSEPREQINSLPSSWFPGGSS